MKVFNKMLASATLGLQLFTGATAFADQVDTNKYSDSVLDSGTQRYLDAAEKFADLTGKKFSQEDALGKMPSDPDKKQAATRDLEGVNEILPNIFRNQEALTGQNNPGVTGDKLRDLVEADKTTLLSNLPGTSSGIFKLNMDVANSLTPETSEALYRKGIAEDVATIRDQAAALGMVPAPDGGVVLDRDSVTPSATPSVGKAPSTTQALR